MENTSGCRLHWDDAPVFLAIARQGTLSAAAQVLGVGVATVSRRIERLERALGSTLFLRHQSGYRLTSEGEDLLHRAEQLESAMIGFRKQALPADEVRGHVRLATAETLANIVIIPALAPLLARYPDLTVEVSSDISTVNLHGHDADLAVRMTRPERGNLKIRRIGSLEYGLYGSKTYMNSRPQSAETLSLLHDRFIGWSDACAHLPAAQWLDACMQGKEPVLRTTTLTAQVQAAIAGIGLAVLPVFVAADACLEKLPISPDIQQPVWLVVHADLSESRRIRVVAEHIVAALQNPDVGLAQAM
ncbi:LysR family transcriptional regulator [Granulosicoccus sp. 3-233]|uniref:LysR family transcriptional regulator n=1 Tax=Granulosicoccus sp. 3-233 TaxID=3417969 RepID=UPI003D32CF72